MLATATTATTSWTFMGPSRRHTLVFEHNTLSGSRVVTLDGAEVHRSGWRYALTGAMHLTVGGAPAEIFIRSDAAGALSYALSVDSKEIPPDGSGATGGGGAGSPSLGRPRGGGGGSGSGRSTWVARLSDGGLHQVEFDWTTLDILVNGVRVAVEAGFGGGGGDDDDGGGGGDVGGATYDFAVSGGVPATLTARPSTAAERRAGAPAMRTRLVVHGVGVVAQSELLGEDDGAGHPE
jgi:hypothetical protein